MHEEDSSYPKGECFEMVTTLPTKPSLSLKEKEEEQEEEEESKMRLYLQLTRDRGEKTLSTEDEYRDYRRQRRLYIGCTVFLHFPLPISSSSSDFVDFSRYCLCSYLSSI